MKRILQNNAKTIAKLKKLPKVYLVVRYYGIAILDFPLAGYTKKKEPLVYDYYDCNGLLDEFVRMPITSTTTGFILGYTESREEAEELRTKYENEKDL